MFDPTSPPISGVYVQPENIPGKIFIEVYSDRSGINKPELKQNFSSEWKPEGPPVSLGKVEFGMQMPGVFIDPKKLKGRVEVGAFVMGGPDYRSTGHIIAVGPYGLTAYDDSEATVPIAVAPATPDGLYLHARRHRHANGKLVFNQAKEAFEIRTQNSKNSKEKFKAFRFDFSAENDEARLHIFNYSHGKTFRFINADVSFRPSLPGGKKGKWVQDVRVHVATEYDNGHVKGSDPKIYPRPNEGEVEHNVEEMREFLEKMRSIIGNERIVESEGEPTTKGLTTKPGRGGQGDITYLDYEADVEDEEEQEEEDE